MQPFCFDRICRLKGGRLNFNAEGVIMTGLLNGPKSNMLPKGIGEAGGLDPSEAYILRFGVEHFWY